MVKADAGALRILLTVAAALCLAIAVLIASGAISSSHWDAWLAGGLLAWVLAWAVA